MTNPSSFQASDPGPGTPVITSPEVLPDNRVSFRIFAPNAHEVLVEGDWQSQSPATGTRLVRDNAGIWSLTVGPLVADLYTYAFTVDGVYTLDPANTTIKHSSERIQNLFLVSGKEIAFAEPQPGPHGEVRIVWYESVTTHSTRRMHIYTPPGYANSNESYPVLYLIHGGGEDDAAWSTIGRAGFIMDNLLAANKVKPMIIVMPNGKIELPEFDLRGSKIDWSSTASVATRIATIIKMHDAFIKDLLMTIIPTVEQSYRVLTDRDNRALAGLSMGAAETLRAGPSDLSKFAYMGVFSVGLPAVQADFDERNAEFFAIPDRSNELVKLLWIAAGSDDQSIGDGARRLSETLKSRGIRHEFHETDGGHTWINWRRYLYDFLQKLFVG